MPTPRSNGKAGPVNLDPRAEALFQKRRAKYEYIAGLSTSHIDIEGGRRNQARLGMPLVPKQVARYTEDAKNGDVFPPVWLTQQDDGTYLVVDGNHRLAGFIAADRPVDAYILTAPPQVLTLLTMEANVHHGLASSEDDRLHHALYLADSGVSIVDAATTFSVQLSKLKAARVKQQAKRRADEAGVPRKIWDSIPGYIQARLANIRTDEGFAEACQLTADAGLNIDSVHELVTELNKQRSAAKQKASVASWREDYSPVIASKATDGQAERTRPGRVAVTVAGRLRGANERLTELCTADWGELSALQLREAAAELDTLAALLEELRGMAHGTDE